MKKLVLTLLLVSCFSYVLFVAGLEVPASVVHSSYPNYNDLPVHNLNTSKDYATIQGAISDTETLAGHIIRVDAGIYPEHVTITKSITLVGEERESTIVDGDGVGTVIQISASNVSLFNLTIRNAGRTWQESPWHLDSCVQGKDITNVRMENDTFNGAAVCVWFDHSSFVNAGDNIVFNATYAGIVGYSTTNFTVYRNLVHDYGSDGIHLDGGSSYCTIINNTVENGFIGISLETDTDSLSATANNLIDGNCVSNNTLSSIGLWNCGANVFRRNNMTNKQHNLVVWGYSLASFVQDIDDSNTVNGKTLYYLTSRDNLTIKPSNYPSLGDLAIINCTFITVRDFNLSSNGDGLLLAYSTNCTLMNLTLTDNREPTIYGGFPFMYGGFTLFESHYNMLINSVICNNSYGLCLYRSDWNIFHHNSFIDNGKHVVTSYTSPFQNASTGYFSRSTWDDGLEGNYWNDYTGMDENNDGIGDSRYLVSPSPPNQYDNYPLMGQFHSYKIDLVNLGAVYEVTLTSNSTITDFHVAVEIGNAEKRIVIFNVTGESGTGFCRVCIPHELVTPPFTVIIDNGETPVLYINDQVYDNGTHRWMYFTYPYPTHKITITPEFQHHLIIAMLITASIIGTITARKRRRPLT